jgi:ADP-ribose pyrophosphatase YjhB (NUDIX family)
MLVVDRHSRLLLIHRSDKCKSAKNVWSLPSGTHEIGENAIDCVDREIQEEFQLTPKVIYLAHQYENIAGDPNSEEHYHWVITLFVVIVDSLNSIVNREPEFHDMIEFVPLSTIIEETFTQQYIFHPSLQEVFESQSEYLFEACVHGIEEYNSNILSI